MLCNHHEERLWILHRYMYGTKRWPQSAVCVCAMCVCALCVWPVKRVLAWPQVKVRSWFLAQETHTETRSQTQSVLMFVQPGNKPSHQPCDFTAEHTGTAGEDMTLQNVLGNFVTCSFVCVWNYLEFYIQEVPLLKAEPCLRGGFKKKKILQTNVFFSVLSFLVCSALFFSLHPRPPSLALKWKC